MNMNERKSENSISENAPEVSEANVSLSATFESHQDVSTPTQTTYESFLWVLNYTKMFVTRLSRDLFESARSYFRSEQILPDHIDNLMKVQSDLCKERELHSATYSRYNVIKRSSNNTSPGHSIQSISLVPESTITSPAYPTQ